MPKRLVEADAFGLYCPAGDFHIDPWKPVPRAVVTHAHADHLRWGCDKYLVTKDGYHVTRARMGPDARIDTLAYGETAEINGVTISFHPAGHVLGSGQIRLEHKGQINVVTGDYKLHADATCKPFESVKCHLFVTETTFGLPIYRWPDPAEIAAQINAWWRANAATARPSVLLGYALGKSQRALAMLDPSIGPILTHGAVEKLVQAYRASGVELPETVLVTGMKAEPSWKTAMVLAPPSAMGTPWLRKFGSYSTGLCSGWMTIRGTRRRKAVDRGFILSDHVDWPTLHQAIDATGAEEVWVTHGYTSVVARWLNERGIMAGEIKTEFRGEEDAEPSEAVAGQKEDGLTTEAQRTQRMQEE